MAESEALRLRFPMEVLYSLTVGIPYYQDYRFVRDLVVLTISRRILQFFPSSLAVNCYECGSCIFLKRRRILHFYYNRILVNLFSLRPESYKRI